MDELLSGEEAQPASAVRLLPREQRRDIKDMMLRVTVDSAQGDKVRVNLPLALVEMGLELGVGMPQVSGNEALKGIDLGKLLELVRQGAIGNLVEVESGDGDTVRIFVE